MSESFSSIQKRDNIWKILWQQFLKYFTTAYIEAHIIRIKQILIYLISFGLQKFDITPE